MTDQVKHKYEYAVDPTADTAPARVVRLIGTDQRVLEIGSGPGSITRLLTGAGRCKVTALEIDPEAIEKVRPFCESVHQADLNNVNWTEILAEKKFNFVVAADVLEHVYDPLSVLKGMSKLMESDGSIVISLPHIGHASILGCLMSNDFEYRDWGLLDKTHIRFFCLKNIQELIRAAQLKIVHAEFVIRHPLQTEFAQRWAHLNESQCEAILENKYSLVYQTVIKAVAQNAPGNEIDLLALKVHAASSNDMNLVNASSAATRARMVLGKYLSSTQKTAIKNMLRQFGLKI